MNIVVPILYVSFCLGLFVPRMNRIWWSLLAGWILLILLYSYLKYHGPLPGQ